MRFVKMTALALLSTLLLYSTVFASNHVLESPFPFGMIPLDKDQARRLYDEIVALFGPTVVFTSFSAQSDSIEPGQPLVTETHTIELTLDEALAQTEWHILLPDEWPDFITEDDLTRTIVSITETTYLNTESEPGYRVELLVPGHLQIMQHFTDGLFPTPGSVAELTERPIRVMATIIHNRPALVYRIAGSTVEITWSTEEFTVSISALRNDLSELEMLRFANSLR